jgi:hypothetical protein
VACADATDDAPAEDQSDIGDDEVEMHHASRYGRSVSAPLPENDLTVR